MWLKKFKRKILLSTMDAAKIYKESKATFLNKEVIDYFCAIDTYEKLPKHLNIDEINIDKKAFFVESSGSSIRELVNHIATVLENLQLKNDVANNVLSTLKGKFNDVLQYLDTKKTDVFEAIIAKITSITSLVSLKDKHFKGSIRGHVNG